ncbi:MAG: 16S rRNA (guanine(966)-N(2))-methyltransferase RsmD [Chlorobi bacterium]|nr:16S rRNA (guanine(966)-N(2))-methyltransferase RsmD [Chlorobiota bacterium]
MRIISGKYKKRKILPPKNLKVRPTTDMAKEALFNILHNNINFKETTVLDLFSGTGNISYEFASRDCKSVTSVELNYRNYSFIKKTIHEFDLNKIEAVKTNVFVYLKHCNRQFDLIFADPPYALSEITEIPKLVFKHSILKKDGLMIIEHSRETDFTEVTEYIQTKKYGKVNFSFFKSNL